MLEIRNLHARVEEKEILKGIDLTIKDGEIHALMGTNGAGKSTLCNVIVGNPRYEVTEGEIIFNGQNLLEMKPEERANAGIFMSFQQPVEIPGVSMTNFMKAAVNARRAARGDEPLKTADFIRMMKEKRQLVEIDQKLMKRSVNEGFSGGEKKRNEIFQMAMLEPTFCILDETDSGLDVDALRIVANGFNKLRTKETSGIIITHYQRLLEYIVPDVVHVLIDGKIVKTGGADLAEKIENEGFEFIIHKL
ncbi:MAG: Fe-S cluster assembly ATPase SufC [Prevotella sp.]|nr:Fe-S cluster assembly ATPase SufC [Prevotella sp.]